MLFFYMICEFHRQDSAYRLDKKPHQNHKVPKSIESSKTMRFNHLFRVLISITLFMFCNITRAEPMLNGIGVHQELGQEVFIGALYSESLSNDAETLMNTAQPMRMELKIVAPDGLTTRRFSRMWIEGMAVNSKADVLTAQANNMVKFDGLFTFYLEGNKWLLIKAILVAEKKLD